MSRNYKTMKVAELKQELEAAGLETSGTKDVLIERLSQYDEQKATHATAEAELAEGEQLGDDVLDGDDLDALDDSAAPVAVDDGPIAHDQAESVADQPSEQGQELDDAAKLKARQAKFGAVDDEAAKLAARQQRFGTQSEKEKIKARQARFGTAAQDPADDEAKKKARQAKFGGGADSTSDADDQLKLAARKQKFGGADAAASQSSKGRPRIDPAELEKLKARAQRFGEITTPKLSKIIEKEKQDKRKERFGETATIASSSDEDAKAKRLKKFSA